MKGTGTLKRNLGTFSGVQFQFVVMHGNGYITIALGDSIPIPGLPLQITLVLHPQDVSCRESEQNAQQNRVLSQSLGSYYTMLYIQLYIYIIYGYLHAFTVSIDRCCVKYPDVHAAKMRMMCIYLYIYVIYVSYNMQHVRITNIRAACMQFIHLVLH